MLIRGRKGKEPGIIHFKNTFRPIDINLLPKCVLDRRIISLRPHTRYKLSRQTRLPHPYNHHRPSNQTPNKPSNSDPITPKAKEQDTPGEKKDVRKYRQIQILQSYTRS